MSDDEDYEAQRLRNIAENRRLLLSMGIQLSAEEKALLEKKPPAATLDPARDEERRIRRERERAVMQAILEGPRRKSGREVVKPKPPTSNGPQHLSASTSTASALAPKLPQPRSTSVLKKREIWFAKQHGLPPPEPDTPPKKASKKRDPNRSPPVFLDDDDIFADLEADATVVYDDDEKDGDFFVGGASSSRSQTGTRGRKSQNASRGRGRTSQSSPKPPRPPRPVIEYLEDEFSGEGAAVELESDRLVVFDDSGDEDFSLDDPPPFKSHKASNKRQQQAQTEYYSDEDDDDQIYDNDDDDEDTYGAAPKPKKRKKAKALPQRRSIRASSSSYKASNGYYEDDFEEEYDGGRVKRSRRSNARYDAPPPVDGEDWMDDEHVKMKEEKVYDEGEEQEEIGEGEDQSSQHSGPPVPSAAEGAVILADPKGAEDSTELAINISPAEESL